MIWAEHLISARLCNSTGLWLDHWSVQFMTFLKVLMDLKLDFWLKYFTSPPLSNYWVRVSLARQEGLTLGTNIEPDTQDRGFWMYKTAKIKMKLWNKIEFSFRTIQQKGFKHPVFERRAKCSQIKNLNAV